MSDFKVVLSPFFYKCSFASFQSATNEYLYNCASDKTTIDNSNEIPKQPVATSTNDLAKVPLDGKFVARIQTSFLSHTEKFQAIKIFASSYQSVNFLSFGNEMHHWRNIRIGLQEIPRNKELQK